MHEQPEATEEKDVGRVSPLRRAMRDRTARVAVVAGLVGVLLGAGAVAWRTDTLPLVSGSAPCWDSLGEGTLTALFGEDREIRSEEQDLGSSPRADGLTYGQCRMAGLQGGERRQVEIRVHELDGQYGMDAHRWPAEFLEPDMVSLGAGLPGMANTSRAWLALPESCFGERRRDFSAATVVDVASGRAGVDRHPDLPHWEEDRDALARAAVDAANGAMRALGCTDTYSAPGALPEASDWEPRRTDTLCGIKGFTLPAGFSAERREALSRERFGGDGGPARVCEVGWMQPNTYLRFTTVVDPALADVFARDVMRGGSLVQGLKGYGSLSETRAAYRAKCGTGSVVFLVEQKRALDDGTFDLTRALLPGYVAAEAERIGCGPEKLKPMPA
ncbi:hypothetical protein OG462_14790 [Streptomyces sp. NBC_01077]|uniref:hypothetical protein n=1 Tax=Streptomyces sp. NBC_01077 TaxID=2903746 RepID=UPI003865EFCF|nr:hypothetical protein OG462_14790 [Streptomyces sp. NBC_01077]